MDIQPLDKKILKLWGDVVLVLLEMEVSPAVEEF